VPQTHIDLAFADGTYRFALGLEQIHELQTKCKAGIGALYARVLQGRMAEDINVAHPAYAAFHITDLVETVRQGLIGGGQGTVDGQEVKVGALRANELIDRYLMPLPLMEQWNLAAAILYAKVEGYAPAVADAAPPPGEDKKKAPRSRKRKPTAAGGLTTLPH
jgi:hypothetical protein